MSLAVWGLLGSVLLTTSCSSQSTARPPVTLTVAVQADVTGLYPDLRNESYTFAVNAALFEGLTRLDRNLNPEPALADRWASPDERTWVFHLRPDVHFSNGDPVRVEDVVASIRFATTLEATRYLLEPVETIEEISPEDVRIRTKFPFPVLLAHLTGASILPARVLSRRPVPAIGTGPFKVEAWVPGEELDLTANPFFHGQRQGFERLHLKVIPGSRDRVRALLDGQAQIIDNVPLERVEELRQAPHVRVVVRPSLKVLFLVLRVTEPHFSDPRVREALDRGIDREELVARALHGFGTAARELVPPAVLGYDATFVPEKPDRSRARALLKAAGYPNGFDIRLEGPSDRYTNGVEIMREVARQLGEIGVRVAVDPMPKARFFAGMDTPRWDLVLYGWSCETVHAGEVLDEIVHTPAEPGSRNVADFSDPALDQLIEDARASGTLGERGQLLAQALRRVSGTRAFLPLVTESESFALSSAVDWDPALDMALHIPDIRLHRDGDARGGAASGR